MRPQLAVESEANNATARACKPERSNPAHEEPHVASLLEVSINSIVFDTKNQICEMQSSDKDTPTQSIINCETDSEQPSTPERPSGPSLEERLLQSNPSSLLLITTGLHEQLSTPERPSDPSLEEQFEGPNSSNTQVLSTDVYMADSENASITTHDEFESLEDITVYEVVTDYQHTPPISTTNY